MAAQVEAEGRSRQLSLAVCHDSVLQCFSDALLGLFERHKLLFSFNMTIKIEQAVKGVPQEELEFFIKGKLIIQSTLNT